MYLFCFMQKITRPILRNNGMAQSQMSEEKVDVRIPFLNSIVQGMVIKAKLGFIVGIPGKVHRSQVLYINIRLVRIQLGMWR